MLKPLLFGLLWWVIVFIEVSIVGFTPHLAVLGDYGFTLLPLGIAVHFTAIACLAWCLARRYVNKQAATLRQGAQAALIMSIVGLVLDAVITVPFFVKSYEHYYSKWTLWVGLFVFTASFIVSTGRAASKQRQRPQKP